MTLKRSVEEIFLSKSSILEHLMHGFNVKTDISLWKKIDVIIHNTLIQVIDEVDK
jgi:hypothetical protein